MTVDQNWMLDEVTGVRGVRHAIVLSADGLVRAHSPQISDDDADRLAGACAGLKSLGQSVTAQFTDGGTCSQVMVEFGGHGFLFVRGAGDGSHLAVVAEQAVDPALIAQQMAAQVLKIGAPNLSTPVRED